MIYTFVDHTLNLYGQGGIHIVVGTYIDDVVVQYEIVGADITVVVGIYIVDVFIDVVVVLVYCNVINYHY